jgi:hypothetical protein
LQHDPLDAGHDDFEHGDPVRDGLLRWCATQSGFVPVDCHLFSYLGVQDCVLYGVYWENASAAGQHRHRMPVLSATESLSRVSMISCHVKMPHSTYRMGRSSGTSKTDAAIQLDRLCRGGLNVFGECRIKEAVASVPSQDVTQFRKESWDGWSIHCDFETWHEIEAAHAFRKWLKPPRCAGASDQLLQHLRDWELGFGVREGESRSDTHSHLDENNLSILFVLYLTPSSTSQPPTLLAQIWHECLGPTAIPFDSQAREHLIGRASQNPEMRRHIEAWRKLKASGSRWAAGDLESERSGKE